ncbi:MAG: EAL domain-containing protein [Dactylosporangium sp.]|nr:EAL domain-containing protein [Dactylosporangium sp.]NNJ59430.1 EAL domain-containing protein [Dactylosporangium sp.]
MGARALALLAVLLRPASALIGRLRYAQKFLVVALVLLVPLGFTANAYVSVQRLQISSTTREQHGLQYLRSLIMLTGDIVQARRSAVSKGHQYPVDLHSDIARVDKIDQRLRGVLDVSREWGAVRRLVLAAVDTEGQPKLVRFRAYQAACDAVLALMATLGDRSSLIHDPDLDSRYLAEALQYWLPSLCDVSGRIADLMELAESDQVSDDLEVFIELGKYYGIVSNTRQLIAHAADAVVVAATDRRTLLAVQEQSRQLNAVTATLGDRLDSAVKHRALREFPSHSADAVRVAANNFASVAVSGLDRLLQARIEQSMLHIRQIEIWTGLGALLAVYLFAGFYVSVASPVKSIVGVLRAVAAGDLTRRVSVNTRDELSFVATVLNETIATTQTATERLALQATRDTLTALPNRAVVIDRLEHALARTRRTGSLLAVLFIDLDRFKLVNDSLGHDAGDAVLCTVAGRLSAVTRNSDTLARLAGDEFVVISEDLWDTDDAIAAAERIVATISEPIEVMVNGSRREAAIGASVGIAFAEAEAVVSPSDLLRDADIAMYRAKQRGRSRVDIFDDSLSAAIERRLQTQHDLRRAIDSAELVVYYQPIVETVSSSLVETVSGSIVGFEALVRWQHPTRGLLAPGDFIETAEESGLIIPLGANVLLEACRQAADWRANRPGCERLRISVNVSAAQFGHPTFIPTVAAALESTGLDPGALWLEITETSVLADIRAATVTLDALRDLGVHLALDDFGTGYSSLTHLRQFPVQVLKIDRSFVSGLGQNREDSAIVEMIVSLAKSLGILVIAEGVETKTHIDELRELGCTTCQGYYLGRPMPADAAWQVGDSRVSPGTTTW